MRANKLYVPLLMIVCFFAFFINNGVIHTDIMESRNIVTAREMVYDGHWLVPTMNGDLRLEKPPLPTWIAAAAEMVSPDDMTAQRAMAGLAATLLVLFFYGFVKTSTRSANQALIASLVLCTSYNLILMGRTASWDVYCHAFMMGAIFFLFKALRQDGAQWGNFLGAGLFLGLSFMGKGPVSFYALLLPFLLSYLIFMRRSLRGKGLPICVMILLCLLVGSWWYVYIYFFHAEEAQYVLHKESTAWVERNVRPWYYYGTFFLETGAWALMVLTALLVPYWSVRTKRREYLFALCWMLLLVVCLSCFPEKKNRYLLPVLIPAAYTVSFLFTVWIEQAKAQRMDATGRGLYYANAGLMTLIVALLPVAAYLFLYRAEIISLNTLIFLTVAFWALAAFMVTALTRVRPWRFLSGVVLLFVFAEIFCLSYVGGLVNNPDFKSISATRDIESLKPLPFYSVAGEELRIEIIYEANKKIRPLDVNDTAAVLNALPCALLTHGRVGEELPASLLNRIDTVWVDCYDNNRRPKNTRRYNDKFLYNVTILKLK